MCAYRFNKREHTFKHAQNDKVQRKNSILFKTMHFDSSLKENYVFTFVPAVKLMLLVELLLLSKPFFRTYFPIVLNIYLRYNVCIPLT